MHIGVQMLAYQQRIRHHMDQLAMDHPKNQFSKTIQPESGDEDPAKLFDTAADAEQPVAVHAALLDGVAHQLGSAGKTAISEWAPQVGTAALAAASSRWSTYWQKPADKSST